MNLQTNIGLPVPAHVPADRVVDYDLYGVDRITASGDIHDGLLAVGERAGHGIFWTPHNGGHWCINDHELLFEAARQPELFSSSAMTIPPMPVEPRLIPLYLDPPIHGWFRAPLMKEFTPGKVRAMEASIRDFANELIDGVADKTSCDFVEAIAEPLPVIIFMRIMGMPLDRLREFRTWVYDMLSSDNERRESSYAQVAGLMDGLIRERAAEPRDDLISHLLAFQIDGRPVTYDEVQAYCLLLFAAGLDTVANALSFAMHHLAADPALQDTLRGDPARIPEAIEELLRRYGVVTPARTATRDVEFAGVTIRKGERVLLMLPSANLDPKVFPEPDRFALDRENKTHFGFNVGPHRCIGSHLARLELKVFWEEWLRRMPNVRHDPDRATTMRPGMTLAVHELPLVWNGQPS